MELVRGQTRIEDLPLFAAAKPRPVPAPEPENPRRTGIEWTEAARRIWEVLDGRYGENAAITAIGIAREAGLWPEKGDDARERSVRKQIEAFYEEFPWPVLSGGSGFFLVQTAKEGERFQAWLRSKINPIGKRWAGFRRQMKAAGFVVCGNGQWAEPPGGIRMPEEL